MIISSSCSFYQKGKTNLDFTEASDSEWQWYQLGQCKCAHRSRQITMPAPHYSVFYRPFDLSGRKDYPGEHRSRQITTPAPHHSVFYRQEGHPACKKLNGGVVICLERCADLHTNCNYPERYNQSGLTTLCPGLTGSPGTRKVKPIWILLKQETVSGSGISWAICKSAPRSRQIAMPAPHHSVFYRSDALPVTQLTVSKH